MWGSTNTSAKTYVNEEVQTVIQRKCQTEVSIKPDQENKKFYSMLEYTPFQDIQDTCERVINLPRKLRLQFVAPTLTRLHLGNCLLLDDDALSELCLDLRQQIRMEAFAMPKSWEDRATQSDLEVYPHILEDDQVAKVRSQTGTQTKENMS